MTWSSSPLVSTSNAGAGTTGGIDTSGANFIAIWVATFGAYVAPSDNKGNTYTVSTGYSDGLTFVRLYWVYAPIVGSGHTFTVASGFPAFFASAWSGSDSSPLDQDVGASSLTPGSLTPGQNDCLILSGEGSRGFGDPTAVSGGLTLIAHIAGDGATCVGGGIAYLVQTSAAAVNETWTDTTGSGPQTEKLSFKAAAGGGGIVGSYFYNYVAGMAGTA